SHGSPHPARLLSPPAAHADRPPFPTRRSSDLVTRDLGRAIAEYRGLGFSVEPGGRHPVGTENALIALRDGAYIELIAFESPDRRSEEHTSELQSHLNLVCRLLLEKKTHNNTE